MNKFQIKKYIDAQIKKQLEIKVSEMMENNETEYGKSEVKILNNLEKKIEKIVMNINDKRKLIQLIVKEVTKSILHHTTMIRNNNNIYMESLTPSDLESNDDYASISQKNKKSQCENLKILSQIEFFDVFSMESDETYEPMSDETTTSSENLLEANVTEEKQNEESSHEMGKNKGEKIQRISRKKVEFIY